MNEKKLFEHGDSGHEKFHRNQQTGEIEEHLYRLWQLFPKADPDQIIKPVASLQSFVVYREQHPSMVDGGQDRGADFSRLLETMDMTLIQ